MNQAKGISEMQANSFHDGSNCPVCQGEVKVGDWIVRCQTCGSLNHRECFEKNRGCGSYHCSPAKSENALGRAGIVITSAEVENAYVPPKRTRFGPARSAQDFLVKKPIRYSVLAILAFATTLVVAILCVFGIFREGFSLLSLGLGGSILTMILAILSLVIINTNSHVRGLLLASASVLICMGLSILCIVSLSYRADTQRGIQRLNTRILAQRPTTEMLQSMDPVIARALRANVVMLRDHIGGQRAVGSGVILRIANNSVWIVSNRHVTGGVKETGQSLQVMLYTEEVCAAQVVWEAPDGIDLTIVRCRTLSAPTFKPPNILDGSVSAGESVFAVGNPMEMYWSYSAGVISSVRQQAQGGHSVMVYQTQTPINAGNSGGGLYRSDGTLIGINTWTQDKSVSEGMNFSLNSQTLLRFLTDSEVEMYLSDVVE